MSSVCERLRLRPERRFCVGLGEEGSRVGRKEYRTRLLNREAKMSERLIPVQALRALAAVLVVIAHAAFDADAVAARLGRPVMGVAQLFDWTFGVHLFFVISGFVMAISARGFGEPGAPARFLLRRIVRIAPLYWLLTAVVLAGAAAAPALMNTPLGGFWLPLASILFIPVARSNGEIRPVLGQGWTLNYEMFFYVAFALAMLLPRRRAFLALTVGLATLVWLGRGLTTADPVLYTWTDGLLIEFLFGLWLGAARLEGLRVGRGAAVALALAGAAAALWLDPSRARVEAPVFVLSGLPAAMLVAAAGLAPPIGREGVGLRLAHLLGDASYSLYLVHPFVIRVTREIWLRLVGDAAPPWVFIPALVLISVLVGIALYRLVERPMTRALQARAARLLSVG